MDLDEMRAFMDAAPETAGDNLDEAARAWLATADLNVTTGDGSPCTLICLMIDEDAECAVYALPQSLLDEAAHAHLAAVNGAAMEWHFNGDLTPEQFAGAFLIFGGSSTEPDVFQDQVEELCEEMADEAPDLDFEALVEAAGAWLPCRLTDGATLPGPVARIYTARLCM